MTTYMIQSLYCRFKCYTWFEWSKRRVTQKETNFGQSCALSMFVYFFKGLGTLFVWPVERTKLTTKRPTGVFIILGTKFDLWMSAVGISYLHVFSSKPMSAQNPLVNCWPYDMAPQDFTENIPCVQNVEFGWSEYSQENTNCTIEIDR